MIFGIGTDILRLDRVQKVHDKYGDTFARRILMPEELELYARAKNPVRFLTLRFAAKEAIVKALGTGFAHGMWVRDTGYLQDRRGQPQVVFSERGQAVCRSLGAGDGFVSLTDEAGLVVAMAVLMKNQE